MNKLICLVGFSACGKDTIGRILEKKYGFHFVVSHTSRPMRVGEQEGVEYRFVSNEDMLYIANNDGFIEYRTYDTIQDGKPCKWLYGITKDEVDLDRGSCVACVETKGLKDLVYHFGEKNIISIFVDADYEVRKSRAMARDVNFELAEFERRYEDDKTKLKDVENIVDHVVVNYDLDECVRVVEEILKSNDII